MTYKILLFSHLATVVPCIFLGAILFALPKGSSWHKKLGITYMSLMFITALITLLMPAQVGPKILNHFGFIHSFSALTLYSVPTAYWAIRRGDVKTHRRKLVLLYIGAILIAGAFTLFPGRYLHQLFFT